MILSLGSKKKFSYLIVAGFALFNPLTNSVANEINIQATQGSQNQTTNETLNQGTSNELNLNNAAAVEAANRVGQIQGAAYDIAIDTIGNMYHVGTQKGPNGYALYKRNSDSAVWHVMQGDALRIAALPNQAWVVNAKGEVFHERGNSWTKVNAPAAKDIGAGKNEVWITSVENRIFRFFNGRWTSLPGTAVKIDVDNNDVPWIVDPNGSVAFFNNNRWTKVNTPKAKDLAASRPGFVQIVDTNGNIQEFQVNTGRTTMLSRGTDAVGIGASNDKVYKLTRNLSIFRIR